MSIRFEDPMVLSALITGASLVAVAVVNGVFQIVCTWLQKRPKKPPRKKPRPKQRRKRRRLPDPVRPPPQDDVVNVVVLSVSRILYAHMLWPGCCERGRRRVPCTDHTFESQTVELERD